VFIELLNLTIKQMPNFTGRFYKQETKHNTVSTDSLVSPISRRKFIKKMFYVYSQNFRIKDGLLVFNGSFSIERLFSAIMNYNLLYKQISFIYCSTDAGCTSRKS